MAALVADSYPLPPEQVVVEVTEKDVKRWLGISIPTAKMADLLRRLELQVKVDGDRSSKDPRPPPGYRRRRGRQSRPGGRNRARLRIRQHPRDAHGRQSAPADGKPRPGGGRARARSAGCIGSAGSDQLPLVHAGAREAPPLPRFRALHDALRKIANPLAYEKGFLRHSVLASVLDIAERNSRMREHLAFFEIGPIFLAGEEEDCRTN